MKVTRLRHGWVHTFITHCPTATCMCITSIRSELVVQVVSALLHGNWQNFNWHDANRGPSAIAELLVEGNYTVNLSTSETQFQIIRQDRQSVICRRIQWQQNAQRGRKTAILPFLSWLCILKTGSAIYYFVISNKKSFNFLHADWCYIRVMLDSHLR